MTPVLVAGGGVAGAAAACLLAEAGHPVRLFERQAQPAPKICGEFLSHEALFYLRRIGIDVAGLGGHEITHLRLVRGGSVATVKLPFRGMGLSRTILDEALLARAVLNGASVRRGQPVKFFSDEGSTKGWRLQCGDETNIEGGTLFLATGKHELRGVARRVTRPVEDLVGLKSIFHLEPAQVDALAGHVEIMLFPDGYAGLQLVEGGRANLCLLVARARLCQAGNRWPDLLAGLLDDCPHLRARLRGAAELLDQPLAIYRVPYGHVHDHAADEPEDIFRLGDQFGVIPSFAGDGMSMALHSAAVAVDCHLRGHTASSFHRRMRRDIQAPIARASAFYRVGKQSIGQAMIVRMAARWPAAVRLAASLTRIQADALVGATGPS